MTMYFSGALADGHGEDVGSYIDYLEVGCNFSYPGLIKS